MLTLEHPINDLAKYVRRSKLECVDFCRSSTLWDLFNHLAKSVQKKRMSNK